MARYLTEDAAREDGFTIVHDAEQHQFAIVSDDQVRGVAHYTLLGEGGIDFDHTVVDPELRGSGLSGLLAHRALTDDIVRGRRIQASCWFIEGYLAKHPELAGEG